MSAQPDTNPHTAAGRCTGPRTQDGKNTSRWNSFKHGLYAQQLVIPGEDPAELDALRASLRAEHQPANTTEDILVNEIAEHFWRLRRMRAHETIAMKTEHFDVWIERGWLALVARQMASAERGMHKALAALRRLQLDRGFVPSKNAEPTPVKDTAAPETEFVPQNAHVRELVSQPSSEYFVPENFGSDSADMVPESPDRTPFSPPSHENAA